MLVFVARDAGDRVSKKFWPKGVTDGVEIEIYDPLSAGKGWCYLLLFLESVPELARRNFRPGRQIEKAVMNACNSREGLRLGNDLDG